MLLDGHSAGEIATRLDPRISHASISNFFRFQVKPALRNAERLAAIEKARSKHEKMPDLFHGDGELTDAEATDLVKEAFGAGVILAARSRRLQELQKLNDKVDAVIEGRAEDLTDEAFGGETGLLVRKYKNTGKIEYLFDKGVFDAKLEISRRIAEETGQWQDGGSAGVVVNIVVPGQATGTPGQVIDVSPVSIALPTRRG